MALHFKIANNLVETIDFYLKYLGLPGYAANDYDDEIGEYNKRADKQHDKD